MFRPKPTFQSLGFLYVIRVRKIFAPKLYAFDLYAIYTNFTVFDLSLSLGRINLEPSYYIDSSIFKILENLITL